jgi:hypothetical protein
LRRVEWIIINEENMEEKLSKLRESGQPLAIFALTGEGYENLGLNFSDIRAMVQQQQAIIVAYENYYKEAEQALDEANKQVQQPQVQQSGGFNLDLNPFD